MASYVDPRVPGPVIELGPGTGPVTDALVRRGVAQDRLVLVEFNPDFCKLLKRRFPKATIIQGDAYDLRETLSERSCTEPAAATVSSLPLFTKPMEQRLDLLETAQDAMHPERTLHPVHLCGGAADPGALEALHRHRLEPGLAQPAAGARVGLPEAP